METTETKKITMATVKSFIKKNRENLLIKLESSFDGMQDMVAYLENAAFKSATDSNGNQENTLGINGAWFVGQSRDRFKNYSDDQFIGIEVHNCCGSFVVAIKK